MEVSSVGLTNTKTTNTDASTSLTETFDTFLSLLTTQLQNQDPLDPMDTEQFTQQLVSFSQVEQSIAANQKLDQLVELQTTSQLSTGVSYIGKSVEVVTDQLMLDGGSATLTYGLERKAAQTVISIVDQNGRPVRTVNGETDPGRHEFVWDGRDANGVELPDGLYGFRVDPVDKAGTPVELASASIGRVTGVEIVDDTLTLNIGELGVPFDKVFAVREDAGES